MRSICTSSLAALALTAGCASKPTHTSPDGGGPDPNGLTPQAFIEQLVTANCQEAFTCMAQYPTTTGTTFADDWGTSQSDCVTTDVDYVARDQIAAAVTAGRITWDSNSAAACLANPAFPASCTDFFTTYDDPESCYSALSGNVADGSACTTSWECAGDTSDCTAGKCAPSTTARVQRPSIRSIRRPG